MRNCDILAGVQAVRQDNKQRFSLLEEDGELLIRANQGHTVTVCSLPEISCTDTEVVNTASYISYDCSLSL
jgi:RNA:NAD 2'-phosphotransferase (TPT1/KptA family)